MRHILVKKKALADQLYAAGHERRRLRGARQEAFRGPGLEGHGRQDDGLEGPAGARVRQGRLRARTSNEISKPVKTQYGWHIIQALTKIKKATHDAAVRGQAADPPAAPPAEEAGGDEEVGRRHVEASSRSKTATRSATRRRRRRPPAPPRPRSRSLSLADALLELQELTERLRRDCPVGSGADRAHDRAAHGRGGVRGRGRCARRRRREAPRRARRSSLPGLLPRAASRRSRATGDLEAAARGDPREARRAGIRTSSATRRRRRRAACASAGRS